MPKGDLAEDPRGLILEAYAMDLGPEDCRTVFLDWVLGRPAETAARDIAVLLAHHGAAHPEHPMTAVLRAGLGRADPPRRRGGWQGRRGRG